MNIINLKKLKNYLFFIILLNFFDFRMYGNTIDFNEFKKNKNYIELYKSGINILACKNYHSAKKKILILSGVHGNEKLPILLNYKLMKLFDKSILRLFNEFCIDILPVLNVYGYQKNTRKNKNLVDLNRNNESKIKELEIKVLQKLIISRKYDLVIDVHGYQNFLVLPSRWRHSLRGRHLRSKLSKSISSTTPYHFVTPAQMGHFTSVEDWVFNNTQAYAFTYELLYTTSYEEYTHNLYRAIYNIFLDK